ncbi:hypothetical protein C1645_750239 [Glomus cerebriforme]|uniref:Peptidase S1 domain-containing protein n=1 Tax=Glomus cerebriforme TaxID=658196 RepID=A0A397TN23_9GLOM|nr:hypothetical protein C1645_750239 [Glomus cerebriforme]
MQIENIGTVCVQKIGRSTGHTYGKMLTTWQRGIVNNLFNDGVEVEFLIVTGDHGKFGDHGDSGSPVYDDNGTLWGIYMGTFENGEVSAVIPISIILEDVFVKEGAEFDLL